MSKAYITINVEKEGVIIEVRGEEGEEALLIAKDVMERIGILQGDNFKGKKELDMS